MARTAFEQLKDSGNLPSPQGAALEILRLADDEHTTLQDLTDVVEKDPATAARLLRYVNSPFAGVSRKIASVSEAVVLLGMQPVRSIALGFSLLSQSKTGLCAKFDYQAFWSESISRAVFSRRVAHRLGTVSADEAFTCGLLCQIGRLAFASASPQAYAFALEQIPDAQPDELCKIEREIFEIDHNELAAEMMTDWNMPARFTDAVRMQGTTAAPDLKPDSATSYLACLIDLSGAVARILAASSVKREQLADATRRAHRLGVNPSAFADIFDALGRELPPMAQLFDISAPKVWPLAEIYSLAY